MNYRIECWNAKERRWEKLPAAYRTATEAGRAAFLIDLPIGCARVVRERKK